MAQITRHPQKWLSWLKVLQVNGGNYRANMKCMLV